MAEAPGVLIVEDDRIIVDVLRSNLTARGYRVVVSTDGSDLLRLLDETAPDVVLLDLMLPGHDGFDLCWAVRDRSDVGIIVLSARRGETDKVRALNLGADDYLTKPFGIEELLARINAMLRRARPAEPRPVAPQVRVGDVRIDFDAQLVTKGGKRVHLTRTEYALLRELAMNPGRLLSHAELLRRVWGPGYETQTEYTRVYVGRLRAKLEGPEGTELIVTEPRAGYRFTTDR
ncbi:response regulator transcription factor [Jiangella alkaliphila]|uniref:Two-component system, OmpR family, KDP operon response regulator KdpE n=1 Tax=Jiangella alkaliphila TaxID=419479 RepID=A0A1H2JRU8_9ACTN|nr:response regulator transcription factor [Jiangella alkaliphila]SDU58888.1 two-component system, OmpR family, KDP operon response regulator KdpE [Jiangella alkaliphila]